jgi:hypothetical protein
MRALPPTALTRSTNALQPSKAVFREEQRLLRHVLPVGQDRERVDEGPEGRPVFQSADSLAEVAVRLALRTGHDRSEQERHRHDAVLHELTVTRWRFLH